MHSPKNGELIDVVVSKEIKPYIKEFYQNKKPSDKVDAFHGADAAIGIAILSFENSEQMNYYMNKILNFISVKVKV